MSAARRYAHPVGIGLVLAGLLFGLYLFAILAPKTQTFGFDAFAYWNVSMPDPYAVPVGALGSFNYSPAFALVADWFSGLDWWVFLWCWTMFLVGTVIWITGSPGWVLVAFSLPFVALELYHGNINILLAAAIVLGFRHPWTWAFVLLTKPSSGVGLLWFLARGEWRSLGIALGATAVIGVASFVVVPSAWFEWVDLLLGNIGGSPSSPSMAIPLWLRLPVAAAMVILGSTHRSTLDGGGVGDACPAGPLVRSPSDAHRRHPREPRSRGERQLASGQPTRARGSR